MILVDTGPLVALFDPRDRDHARMRDVLREIRTRLVTTVPVLTEVFHLVEPSSRGAHGLREFINAGGCDVWFMAESSLARAFELMEKYADHPMDLADASLVAAAEGLRATEVLTLDRRDFGAYRVRIGRSLRRFRLVES